jgi:hypothetical protein
MLVVSVVVVVVSPFILILSFYFNTEKQYFSFWYDPNLSVKTCSIFGLIKGAYVTYLL